MSYVGQQVVRGDQFGHGHTVTTARCDGPGCDNTIKSNDPKNAEWGAMLGFVNVDELPDFDDRPASKDWCSVPCLKRWAAEL